MSKEDLIHIKFSYSEALNAKKDLLSSQIRLLKIEKAIKDYGFYRGEELEMKGLLYKKVKEFKSIMTNLQKVLPKADLPEILKKDNQEDSSPITLVSKKKSYDVGIEGQLQEIQRRLNELQERNI